MGEKRKHFLLACWKMFKDARHKVDHIFSPTPVTKTHRLIVISSTFSVTTPLGVKTPVHLAFHNAQSEVVVRDTLTFSTSFFFNDETIPSRPEKNQQNFI